MLVGVWSVVPFDIHLEVAAELSVDGTVGVGSILTTELTLAELELRDASANDPDAAHDWLEATRHLGDIRVHLHSQAESAPPKSPDPLYPRTRFYEVVLRDLPAGQLLRFAASARIPGTTVRAEARPLGVWLVAPEFTAGDVVATRTFDNDVQDDQWWVLMHRRENGFDHLRLDLLGTANLTRHVGPASNLAPVSVSMDGQVFDITQPPAITEGPIDAGPINEGFVGVRVDRSTDSVLITRRHGGAPLPAVIVTTRTDNACSDAWPVDLAQAKRDYTAVSLMLIAYAIQGLNDLFTEPLSAYRPARNFAEVAYCDEQALFSGRPETQENGVGDGYRFVLTAQRHYDVAGVWVFNAGALLLLKHSLRQAWFDELVQAVHDGVISVGNAGTGAHRNCCYAEQTNVEEITRADALIRRVLTDPQGNPAVTNKIYFPDSRIYQATEGERAAYAKLIEAGLVRYAVFDRSTVAHSSPGPLQQLYFPNQTPQSDDGNYLWQDSTTGLKVLLIEDRVRDHLVGGSDDEVPRGQLQYDLRRMFMRSLDRDRDPDLPRRLFCFGDDIDHLAGNGWFDGNYRNRQSYTNAFLAALCWLHTHPWMQARTPDDPGFDAELRRHDELTISSAIDASMDPGGASTTVYREGDPSPLNCQDEPFHFDAWVTAWKRTESPWLQTTLGTINHDLEQGLVRWPSALRGELSDIAWTYFLSCTHEGMWSKEPVEPHRDRNVLDYPFRWEPEDFVISETLQMRNAWVYLNAAVWADWAEHRPARGNFVLDLDALGDPRQAGPLLEPLRAAHAADAWWPGAPAAAHGLYWDRDNLANVVLYNSRVLAVLDRNGGRLTQLFCRAGGRAISVSGTNKAYQFLEVGPPQVACDGSRVQNTVYTANHGYVGTDVTQAAPRAGSYQDQRGKYGPNPTWLPDNFNAYVCHGFLDGAQASVECRYEQSSPDQLPENGVLSWDDVVADLCTQDADRLRAGQPGIVWHDSPGFAKTIQLDGRRIHVSYTGTQPGHLVTNEFSVDLLDLLKGGDPQRRTVRGRTATIKSATGFRVRVVLGQGCEFTPETRLRRGPRSRVLTEDIRIVATQPDFDYTIELPR